MLTQPASRSGKQPVEGGCGAFRRGTLLSRSVALSSDAHIGFAWDRLVSSDAWARRNAFDLLVAMMTMGIFKDLSRTPD